MHHCAVEVDRPTPRNSSAHSSHRRPASRSPHGTRLPLSDRMRASRNAPRRLSLGTTRERAVRARAEDRNRGRKRAQTGGRGRTSVDRPERGRADPPPPGRPSGHACPVRGLRAADARHHAIGLLDIGVPPQAPWSSSTSSRRPPSSPARRPDRLCLPNERAQQGTKREVEKRKAICPSSQPAGGRPDTTDGAVQAWPR
jgi:hypothetical protein